MPKVASAKRPLIVGIGGQAGSGKSTVARYFARRGAEIIDADRIGWNLLLRSASTCRRVVDAFGTDILNSKGNIDRKTLGKLVFANPVALQRLNRIVHPPLLAELRRQTQAPGKPIKVIDAALLFSWGWDRKVDIAIMVTATEPSKLGRMSRTGISQAMAAARIKNQMSEATMRKRADLVVENNGTRDELRQQCRKIWQLFQSKLAEK
jgi:dephospho-CoA kinase